MKKKLIATMMVSLGLLLTACQGERASKKDIGEVSVSQEIKDAISSGAEADSKASADSSTLPIEERSDDAAVMRMADDLLAHVAKSEGIYGDLLWALDSLDVFDRERTWENLLIARGTVDLADADIQNAVFPEAKMTADDLRELLKKGIDVSFLESSKDEFEADQETAKNTLIGLKYDTMMNCWLGEDWSIAKRKAAVLKKLYETRIQYLASTVEWVLASVGDKAMENYVRSTMQKTCPRTAALLPDTLHSPEEIEASGGVLVDKMSEITSERGEVNGFYAERLNTLKDQVMAGDFQTIGADILEIEGDPWCLVCPDWLNYEHFRYSWTANGVPQDIAAQTVITYAPNVCRVEEVDVAREDVEAFLKDIEESGFEAISSAENTDNAEEMKNISRTYRYGAGTLSIEYTDEGAGIGTVVLCMEQEQIFFANDWYFDAKYAVE